jgi:hypothetical protein
MKSSIHQAKMETKPKAVIHNGQIDIFDNRSWAATPSLKTNIKCCIKKELKIV